MKIKFSITVLSRVLILGVLGGFMSCTPFQQDTKPDLQKIYNKAASQHDADTIPVIVIPGVLGSNLKEKSTGRSAWGAFVGDYLKPSSEEGLQGLAIQPSKGVRIC